MVQTISLAGLEEGKYTHILYATVQKLKIKYYAWSV